MAVCSVLRRANKHLHKIIVQCIEELALKAPFKLRIVEIARVQIEIVGVHGDGFIFELDDDLDTLAFLARGEVQQGMLVET